MHGPTWSALRSSYTTSITTSTTTTTTTTTTSEGSKVSGSQNYAAVIASRYPASSTTLPLKHGTSSSSSSSSGLGSGKAGGKGSAIALHYIVIDTLTSPWREFLAIHDSKQLGKYNH